MPNFSNEELAIIKSQRLAAPPEYYSSDLRTPIEISPDFEAYLILQSQDQKQKSLDWIQQVQSISTNNSDRDALLKDYLAFRKDQANKRIMELDTKLGNYDEYRTGLLSNPTDAEDANKFADVTEVTTMARILQRPIDSLNLLRERAYHETVLVKYWENRMDVDKYDAEGTKELTSWEAVISAYEGEKGSVATSSGAAQNRTMVDSGPATKALLKKAEGYTATPTNTESGTQTIGFGHTINNEDWRAYDANRDGRLNQTEADKLLDADVDKNSVWKKDLRVPVTPGQEAAITSLAMSKGSNSSEVKSLVSKLNAGRPESEIAQDIMKATKANSGVASILRG